VRSKHAALRLIALLCAGLSIVRGEDAHAKPSAEPHAARLVIIKVDGLPASLVERRLNEINPSTGKSCLPWIHRVFLEGGAWVRNFYVRGISLSAPSWQMLDTGHPLLIHGNAEYDRYTGRVYDYLNFFPFYLAYSRSKVVDMPEVEVLDQSGVPMLIDRFPWPTRYQSMQLLQRGVRWKVLRGVLMGRIKSRSPLELFNEWQIGFGFRKGLGEQVERDIRRLLAGDRALYLDYFFGEYDHVAHLTHDVESQGEVLDALDRLVGRLWASAQAGPLAAETLFILVSDHGMNTDPEVFSQGYNLVRFFGSREGGGHHVLTNRHPMTEYKLKGLDPFVSEVITPSPESSYLEGQSQAYPTAALDLDGNERASVYLRNSDLNAIHILLQQLNRTDLSVEYRSAVEKSLSDILDRRRASWTETAREVEEELAALTRAIERRQAIVNALPKKWTHEEQMAGRSQDARRSRRELEIAEQDRRAYSDYLFTLRNLLELRPGDLEPGKIRIEMYVPRRALGDANTIAGLQRYVTGLSVRGLVLDDARKLDLTHTFAHIDYPAALANLRVRNNVQAEVGSKPVDFIAMRVPAAAIAAALADADRADEDAVWLYGDELRQALILAKRDGAGQLLLRYLPVRNLRQNDAGAVTFEAIDFGTGLPLHLFEDPDLEVSGDRVQWLSEWHSEQDWLKAIHRTRYSNGLIGLYAYFAPMRLGRKGWLWDEAGEDEPLLRRFALRKRELARPDLLILANDHWNFNVRGFNPGGNHGSFFRIATHSVWMMAGAGVRPGVIVDEPCDSLSFVPTVLRLMGASESELAQYPGRPIDQVIAGPPARSDQSVGAR
jgi:hypothetical protein